MVSLLAALALCGLVGFLTGLSVSGLRIPPLIATLGSMWVVQGIGYSFLKGVPTRLPGAGLQGDLRRLRGVRSLLGASTCWRLQPADRSTCCAATGSARWVYAVGGNEYAAYISGDRVAWVKVAVYTASALLAGIAGFLVGAFASVGYPRACNGYELYAIAAIVMGGISLTGGRGTSGTPWPACWCCASSTSS